MKLVAIIPIIILFFSCKKDEVEIDFGYDYVLLDSGLTIVYQVRDIFHDEALLPAHDTNYYQIKTVFSESFTDEVGDDAVKIRRFLRENDSLDWEIKDVWTVKNTVTRTEVVEENSRYIDFIFAPTLTKTWNANALNQFEEKSSRFKSVHQPFAVNGFKFDSACVVSHQEFTSFIGHNIEYDVFAKGIGKIYSVHKELRIDNFDTLDVKKGFEIEYQMIDFSK
ncbi:MAG: hypothetical protein AB8B72_04860 [Crocinitomicaceae bacterium]